MNLSELLAPDFPLVKKHWLPLGFGFFGLILFIYGLIVLVGSSKPKSDEIIFESGQTSTTLLDSAKTTKSEIVVDIEGAVIKPGVYRLPTSARVQDALVAAGGLSAQANRLWVEKNLNLANKLNDGTKIYIPREGEENTSVASGAGGQTGILNSQININTASSSELDSLPGIGPVTTEKIINGRPYGSIEELLSKKIVGSSVFSQIKERITAY